MTRLTSRSVEYESGRKRWWIASCCCLAAVLVVGFSPLAVIMGVIIALAAVVFGYFARSTVRVPRIAAALAAAGAVAWAAQWLAAYALPGQAFRLLIWLGELGGAGQRLFLLSALVAVIAEPIVRRQGAG